MESRAVAGNLLPSADEEGQGERGRKRGRGRERSERATGREPSSRVNRNEGT